MFHEILVFYLILFGFLESKKFRNDPFLFYVIHLLLHSENLTTLSNKFMNKRKKKRDKELLNKRKVLCCFFGILFFHNTVCL